MLDYKNLITVLIVLIFGCSCSSVDESVGSYNSSRIYDKALFSEISRNSFAYQGPERNPVIVIHGFLGSRLIDKTDESIVWGKITGEMAFRGYSPEYLKTLSLPLAKNKKLSDLRDNVFSESVLSQFQIKVLGLRFNINAYNKMLDILIKAGYVPEIETVLTSQHVPNLFSFHYDWRRDLPENAAKLHDFIIEKRKMLQQMHYLYYGIEKQNIQFDIIAHSMGGLVARYYIRYGNQDLPLNGALPRFDWRGSKYVDKLLILGTPNSGYLDTLVELTNGLSLDPDAPVLPPAFIGTFPSYYQMLPHSGTSSVVGEDGKEIDIFDVAAWKKYQWGLADPGKYKDLQILLPDVSSKKERYEIAVSYLEKCLKRAKQFSEAMRIYKKSPQDLLLILFAGDAVYTPRRATVNENNGVLTVDEYDAGDGKVLVTSAMMDEREGKKWVPYLHSPIDWDVIIFLKAAHMGITESYSFADNASFYLLSFPPKHIKEDKNRFDRLQKKSTVP